MSRARAGHPTPSEACLVAQHELQHTTCDGRYLVPLAGAWVALVVGFGGMREDGGSLAPR